ncbi:unnamed protein product, partial [Scytosiphon promiscuus]
RYFKQNCTLVSKCALNLFRNWPQQHLPKNRTALTRPVARQSYRETKYCDVGTTSRPYVARGHEEITVERKYSFVSRCTHSMFLTCIETRRYLKARRKAMALSEKSNILRCRAFV